MGAGAAACWASVIAPARAIAAVVVTTMAFMTFLSRRMDGAAQRPPLGWLGIPPHYTGEAGQEPAKDNGT